MSFNRWTIMKKLSALILLALAVALGFFVISYNFSNYLIDSHGSRNEIDRETISSLAAYVEEGHVKTDDAEALLAWCDWNRRIDIEVYAHGALVFSSIYDVSKSDYAIAETEAERKYSHSITFSDGPADVVFYDYLHLYDRALVINIIESVLLFFGIFILGIRREVRYIRTLNDEIHALEGGDLTREITIRGNDELAMLAESVDEFRKSMRDHLGTIEELEKNNRQMSAEIAHDLRTPLTSLIMYLDFTLSELEDREPQAREYVTKAKERSVRLKNLLEENFNYTTMPDYFLLEKQTVPAYEVLGVALQDMMTYLERGGFPVRADLSFGHSSIRVQRDALARVCGNLSTNILKYADKNAEVQIICREKEKHVEVCIRNRVRTFEGAQPESTGFGARIVRRLMEEMDGEYQAQEEDGVYTTILRFARG